MNTHQLQKFISALANANQRELVLRMHSKEFKKNLAQSQQVLEKLERNMRIQKLEMAVKRLNLTRSWV